MSHGTVAKLAIAIPTYNRAEFLDHVLAVHVPMAKNANVAICVYDNASSDHTADVVAAWKEKYPLIKYYRNDVNLGAENNFELALTASNADYVWLLGDTYVIRPETFYFVLRKIDEGFDHILLNIGDEVRNVPCQVFTDQNSLLCEMHWLTTCLSVHVFSRKLISGANFERYQNTYFIHVGVLFEYLAGKTFRVLWSSINSIDRVDFVGGERKSSWNDKYFEIWIKARAAAIFSLPPSYSLESKLNAIKWISSNHGRLDFKRAFIMRARGYINLKVVMQHRKFFSLYCSRRLYYIIIISSVTPRCFFVLAKNLNRRVREWFF